MNWWQYTLLSLSGILILVLTVRGLRGIFGCIHWLWVRFRKTPPAPYIPCSLLNLRIQMERTNFWFHLVRNNPRHREQYYFALIAMVGYENWKNVDPTLRMNWESARLSFDRMYGMVKDFAENAGTYTKLFPNSLPQPEKIDVLSLKNTTTEILRKTGLLSKEVGDKTLELTSKLTELEKKFDHLESLLPPQDKVKEVRDALNEWIPPENEADKK